MVTEDLTSLNKHVAFRCRFVKYVSPFVPRDTKGLRELNICETEICKIKVCELDLEK